MSVTTPSVTASRRRGAHRLGLSAFVLVTGAALAGCSAAQPPPPVPVATQTPLPTAPATSATTLSEAGSTLLEPLFKLWAPGYQDTFPQVTVTVAGGGSGKGISSAAAGTADIGASDAYLSPADVSQTPTLQNIPLAVSAQM